MGKQRLEMEQKPDSGTESENATKKKLDLSVPQVAGSAFAAVVAAVLASKLGVYGTIIGAGVVSVIATCGGTIFQHLFRRTGEQIREVTVQVKPKGPRFPTRQMPVSRVSVSQVPGTAEPGEMPPTVAAPWPDELSSTTTGGRRAGDRAAPGPGPDATRLLPLDGEFTEATTHGTRVRGWKRSSLAAGVAFLVAMSGITGFELLSGHGLSGGSGTTVGSAVQGGGTKASKPSPAPSHSTEQDRQQGGNPDPSRSPDPSPSRSSGDGGQTGPGPGKSDAPADPAPSPSPPSSGDASTAPDPAPSGPADSGTGGTTGHDGTVQQDKGAGSGATTP
ncbi:hypothetical protein [Streptomyces sp. NBC_01766]|uniref:hypothetical protein n=1 Tax=Streptomyces sp. NBC_01766 TaxID=2975936 RepID=UPI002DDBF6B8|nr:hypothetical protein [Streptomyces sp. NBC_01766]WSC19379.1 hypothetical protein OIE60_06605 [Streptomyces sp. NBC_01766]